MAPLLAATGLRKAFGALVAVEELTFEVHEGEVLGIAGPNGSGKSTTFNLISRLPYGADGGRVEFLGRRIDRLAPHRIAQRGLIRTFQREAVFESLSCIDNILVAVEQTLGVRGRKAEQFADEASELVGFPRNFHNRRASTLPVFYQKQLMMATAVAQRPKLLLLDEPASSLVDAEIDWVRETVLRLRASGVTLMLIEHVLPLLLTVSDRLLVMEEGRMIALGNPRDVINEDSVRDAYLGAAS